MMEVLSQDVLIKHVHSRDYASHWNSQEWKYKWSESVLTLSPEPDVSSLNTHEELRKCGICGKHIQLRVTQTTIALYERELLRSDRILHWRVYRYFLYRNLILLTWLAIGAVLFFASMAFVEHLRSGVQVSPRSLGKLMEVESWIVLIYLLIAAWNSVYIFAKTLSNSVVIYMAPGVFRGKKSFKMSAPAGGRMLNVVLYVSQIKSNPEMEQSGNVYGHSVDYHEVALLNGKTTIEDLCKGYYNVENMPVEP